MVSDTATSDSLTVSQAAKQIEGLMARGTIEPAVPTDASAPTQPDRDADEEPPAQPDVASDDVSDEPEDDAPEADADQPDEQTEALYPVTVDGKVQHVKLKDALKSYSGQAAINRRLEEVALKDKAIEAERQRVAQEREHTAELWTQLRSAVEASTPAEPDWNHIRATEGNEGFAAKYATWQLEQRRLGEVRQQEERAKAKVDDDRFGQFQQQLAQEQQRLLDAIPDWKDESKAKTEQQQLIEFGKTVGFSEQELTSVVDHRAILILRDAMRYRKLKQGAPKGDLATQIQAAKASPVMAPGSSNGRNPTTELTKLKQSHAKLQTKESAAALILAAMNAADRNRSRGR